MLSTLLLSAIMGAAGLSATASARKFIELAPLKGAMLMKTWQAKLTEVDQKVGIVPDLETGGTAVGVLRFGDELERRTLCKKQFQMFHDASFGLALADKADYPAARREMVKQLKVAGESRGANTLCYSSLPLAGGGSSTLSLVECLEAEWSLLALAVNPEERQIPVIVEAELATLTSLRELADESGAALRVHSSVERTLAGSKEALGLVEPVGAAETTWFLCGATPCSE